jgi:ketosteroid isomerase-like protein
MDAELHDMLEHYRITKVLNEYCHGCDRLDEARMGGVYLEDSWDDHGHRKCAGKEFAAQTMVSLVETTNMCSHQLGQSLIKVNGNEAGAETYFIASLRVPAEGGGEALNQMGGRYVDTLHKVDGQWKIKKRICVRDWSITHRIENDFLRGAPFVEGERTNADPSFAALGIRHSGSPHGR